MVSFAYCCANEKTAFRTLGKRPESRQASRVGTISALVVRISGSLSLVESKNLRQGDHMSERRCLFCDEPFTGQNQDFEHVIPRWLVREADLSKRTSPIDFPSKKFNAAMSRIGGRACETCNAASSDLESRASIVYAKSRDGEELSSADGRVMLDWLDKVRIGLWLWTVDIGKADYGINPKFRINERMAHKDRILFAARYAPDPKWRGLEIWGANEYFVYSPAAIGLLINNIALVSVSSDFLVSRHLTKLSIKRWFRDAGDLETVVEPAEDAGPRLQWFGAPFILGQVILPSHLFAKLGLKLANLSALHQGWGEGPVLKLNGKLEEAGTSPDSVALKGNRDAHVVLMELYLDQTAKYLLEDFLSIDFSKLSNPERRQATEAQARDYLARTEVDILRAKTRYERLTRIRLP